MSKGGEVTAKEGVGGRRSYHVSICFSFLSHCNELLACIIGDESFYSH